MSQRKSPTPRGAQELRGIHGAVTGAICLSLVRPFCDRLRAARWRAVIQCAISRAPSRHVCRQTISDSWLGNLRECLAHLVKGSGCDCLLVQAASVLDGFSFDLFPPFKNGLTAP